MAKFEVLQEGNSLCHTNVAINLEAHICYRISRVDVSDDILRDDVQTWTLYVIQS